MQPFRCGEGIIIGKNPQIAQDVVIWNYVVIGDNIKIGKNTKIGSFCDIARDVEIGENCIIQAHVTISTGCQIGNNVFIGPNTTLLNDRYPNSTKLRPVIIKDNAIIGGGVIILPDVIIGEKAVVAGAAVVSKDVPKEAVVKSPGLPARIFSTREEFNKKKIKYETGPNRAIPVDAPETSQ